VSRDRKQKKKDVRAAALTLLREMLVLVLRLMLCLWLRCASAIGEEGRRAADGLREGASWN